MTIVISIMVTVAVMMPRYATHRTFGIQRYKARATRRIVAFFERVAWAERS